MHVDDHANLIEMLDFDAVVGETPAWQTIGATGRAKRHGPESALVDRFVATLDLPIPSDCRATVFREPRLDSGFPDVVVVVWRAATALQWPRARALLRRDDLRVAQLLRSARGTDDRGLRQYWPRPPLRSLARLEAGGLIERSRGRWQNRPLAETFAVRDIIAFEAKMTNWREAIEQATLNRWFATRSNVLLPDVASRSSVVTSARARGVGVWVQGRKEPAERAKGCRTAAPQSYASWLFNEWCWRITTASGRSPGVIE